MRTNSLDAPATPVKGYRLRAGEHAAIVTPGQRLLSQGD